MQGKDDLVVAVNFFEAYVL